eukprot:gene174-251_t
MRPRARGFGPQDHDGLGPLALARTRLPTPCGQGRLQVFERQRTKETDMKRVLISAALLLSAGLALAQGYPNKPIRIVVPFTPGSATDIMARIVGEKLGTAWGQTVI